MVMIRETCFAKAIEQSFGRRDEKTLWTVIG